PGDAPDVVANSHVLAQFLADGQLASVEGTGRARLALDLPIGSHPDGYETWAFPQLFATETTVGAPPDEFFTDGQDWGFPPQLPGAGRRSGHELWRRLVARAGEHASILRIDHVMGVHRLWWIPHGAGAADGVYVRYPREELLAVIAAEAQRTSTTIVGEDLGTVPDDVRAAMRRWRMIGLYEEQFFADGRPRETVPAHTVAGIRTHDMPAFAAFVGSARSNQAYRARLECELGHPVPVTAGGLLDGALERLTASDAYLVLADLDDLVGETAPHNVPGLVLANTWRRRLRRPTSEVLDDPAVGRRLHAQATRRRRHRLRGEEHR
ncbi:MAG: 4-alpha-glucanotransferase, partial [Actinomycetota bacterium]|nr:4-alpha-glucanotransferase [Actinomycetota bacterium]